MRAIHRTSEQRTPTEKQNKNFHIAAVYHWCNLKKNINPVRAGSRVIFIKYFIVGYHLTARWLSSEMKQSEIFCTNVFRCRYWTAITLSVAIFPNNYQANICLHRDMFPSVNFWNTKANTRTKSGNQLYFRYIRIWHIYFGLKYWCEWQRNLLFPFYLYIYVV